MASIEQLRQAILKQGPTDEQKNAIFANELEFLLRASPGSGKTWTSCRRFIWRAANWPYSVGGLALLSFTNTAIREFKTATNELGRGGNLSDPNFVGTFDSFVERYILAPFGHLITGTKKRPQLFLGARPGDLKNTHLKVWMEVKNNRNIPVPAWEIIPYPDSNKTRFKTSNAFGGKPVNAAYNPVLKLLALGFYTHPQRVFWACELLSMKPHIAGILAKRFPEIIVDEAQDSNAWLLELLNLLREKGSKITLIGDPDQCIYEFSMADATSLTNLKKKWRISEKPLSRSFRCNNQIAAAVGHIGGNPDFNGSCDGKSKLHRPYVLKESSKTFSDGVVALQNLAKSAGVGVGSSAIVCRAHRQLESIRGEVNYTKLKGKAKELTKAAFLRDSLNDYRRAFLICEKIVRELTGDDPVWESIDAESQSPECQEVTLAIWQFVKDPKKLPPVSQLGNDWISSVRSCLQELIEKCSLKCEIKLGNHIKTTGLTNDQKSLPLFASIEDFPIIRQDTIHQVKGESIEAVLVIGSAKFWNSVVEAVGNENSTEDRRLAYVAMSRAINLLIIALPSSHFDKHEEKWKKWGFELLPDNWEADESK